jgi:hypothetical protein
MNVSFPQTKLENDCFQIAIDPSELLITKQQIINELGYSGREIPEYFSEVIDEILAAYPGYCDIRAGYRILDIEPSTDRNDGLFVGGRFFNLQKTVTVQLKNAEKGALFSCTIGSRMETWATQLFEDGDALRSHFVDIVGSITVERVTDILHDYIGDRMKEQELSITNRFSPGYCGWAVSEQQVLFSFFPEGFCGIMITPSSLMLPKKSTSGIIGIGSAAKREPYFCDKCTREGCTYRTFLLEKKSALRQM